MGWCPSSSMSHRSDLSKPFGHVFVLTIQVSRVSFLRKISKIKITFPFQTVLLCAFFHSFLQIKSHWVLMADSYLQLAIRS